MYLNLYLYLTYIFGTANYISKIILFVSLIVIFIILCSIGFCMCDGLWDGESKLEKEIKKFLKYLVIIFFTSVVLVWVIPDKKTMYMETAIVMGKELENYDEVPEIMQKTYMIVNGELDILLKDIDSRKSEKD